MSKKDKAKFKVKIGRKYYPVLNSDELAFIIWLEYSDAEMLSFLLELARHGVIELNAFSRTEWLNNYGPKEV